MIDIVKELEKNGFTYRTSDGIYFDTSRFDSYCKFARLNPDSLRAGERVEMGEKRSATDFALWKFSPTDKKRQMEWQSPWGIGFPGWHIECSAMAQKYLSLPIDIHCGGSDHIRVHHTNEIAQSEAATGKQFVRYWLHGEFLVLDKGKMAKSDGNFITLDSIKEANIPQLAYRLFCFTAHYRTPLTFSWEGLQASVQSLQNLRSMVPDVDNCGQIDNGITDKLLHPFYMAVYDDLNMPRAVAALWDLLRDRAIDPVVKRACVSCADEILGLDLLLEQRKLSEELIESDGVKIKLISESRLSDTDRINIVEKIRVRKTARKSRDFTTADRIRDELGGLGITIKDLPDGTTECTIPASVPG
jgi:cysteinyl-tRNA synthetase